MSCALMQLLDSVGENQKIERLLGLEKVWNVSFDRTMFDIDQTSLDSRSSFIYQCRSESIFHRFTNIERRFNQTRGSTVREGTAQLFDHLNDRYLVK